MPSVNKCFLLGNLTRDPEVRYTGAGRLKLEDEIRFEKEFLTGVQRQKFKVAKDYADELLVTLHNWWMQAAMEDDASEAINMLRDQLRDDIRAKTRTIRSRTRPHRAGEKGEDFRRRVRRNKQQRADAFPARERLREAIKQLSTPGLF